MWQETSKNIGKVKQNSKADILFKYLGEKRVARDPVHRGWRITTSCGCSSAKWDPQKGELTVSYGSGEIPKHLTMKGQTSYTTIKYITVNWEDGTSDKLSFTVEVTK
jgi:hypothetical protein